MVSRRVDLSTKLGPARSQGHRSTCLAFAVSAAHETALYDEHDLLDTSEEYLYWSAKQHDTAGPGTTFAAVRDGLAANGQPLEEAWPYDKDRKDHLPTYQPPAAAHSAQPRWSPQLSPVPATPKSVRTELDAGRAVVLGIPTWPDLDTPTEGRLSVPAKSDLDGAHHAVVVIGYDEQTAEMLIRNSWSETWGIDGTAWLPFAFLDEHLCATWVIAPATVTATAPVLPASAARYGSEE
ncbi:MAG: C1 family peptidase [Actinomycetota bacterium]|jgi:C1A family cysteine protease|nr:C1 family peptidase [Actinomycetota bacterium]MDA8074775.1 C1 family peptidase [Actinomycetota bacterium]